jgi:hypothetical protein
MEGNAMSQTEALFTVSNRDGEYNSPMIGNGEIVTTLGPTGFHNGYCPAEETANRTLFWAGRRLYDSRSARIRIPRVPLEELIGPTIPLVRFGRLSRTVTIDGMLTKDDVWQQTLDYDRGCVISIMDHGAVQETTESMVCLTANVLIFKTCLHNLSAQPHQVVFQLDYEFGDSEGLLPDGARLHIRRPHPDDLGFGNVDGARSTDSNLAQRPPHVLESLSVQYEIEKHLGEIHIGRFPNGVIQDTEKGGRCLHNVTLAANGSEDLWLWVTLSDRMKYTHFPTFEKIQNLLTVHYKAWYDFWQIGRIDIHDPVLNGIRQSCLYTLRCNASPWTIPPGYLSTTWEGRTFHDEFYPFMALISTGHTELAKRIPNYRLSTLPHALARGHGNGAYYGWEVTETGEESAPYGHWTDEQFRHGQISEQAWRYYLITGDLESLERYYPVIRGCAEWMIHDTFVHDEHGRLKVRTIADVSEGVITSDNSIFAACAAVRCLENAAAAATILKKDLNQAEHWKMMAEELRHNLPFDEKKGIYRYADDVDIPAEMAHLAMVFPFSFNVFGKRSTQTMKATWAVYQQQKDDVSSDVVFSYNWIWAVGRLATLCFYLGWSKEGFEVLQKTHLSLRSFLAPNEHYNPKYGAFLPWLTSGAGAWIYAFNAMFVQIFDEEPPIILPAVPETLAHATLTELYVARGITLCAVIRSGKPIYLSLQSPDRCSFKFRIPEAYVRSGKWAKSARISKTAIRGLRLINIKLKKGENVLLQSVRPKSLNRKTKSES